MNLDVTRMCLVQLAVCIALALSGRTLLPLDGGWTFARLEAGAGAQWQAVSIPHCWNAADGTTADYYRGPAQYRCRFDAPAASRRHGSRTFVRFEAVSQDATVWLNGRRLGRHRGAFTAFCFELTALLKPTGNELVVDASNAADSLILPLEGDFTLFGGIYRPVWLLVLPQACFTPLDHASCGVYVSQRAVSAEQATLDVVAKVALPAGAEASRYSLRTSVYSPGGRLVATQHSGPGTTGGGEPWLRLEQRVTVEQPELWQGTAHPAQHRFHFELLDDGQVVDTLSQLVGLRHCQVDPHRGFFLNGQSWPLRGVNRHQDRDGMGWAITSREHRQDMELIQEIGANSVRLAHYPHADEFYSLCDRAGLLAWAEIPYIGHGTRHPAFDANARQQLTELIRQNYNHCSIYCWSLFNELGGPDRPHELVEQLNDLAHREDPTRFTVAAANQDGRPENNMPDIMAYNTYPGWYWADPGTMQWAIDWKYDPATDRAVGISEYGAGASIHHHDQHIAKAPKTDGDWHPEEWQALVHEGNYREIAKRPYVWGAYVWNMFDFASASRHEGDRMGINDKGLVTYDRRTRKDAFYFYQAVWAKPPMVHIASRRHNPRTEAVTDVKVYSNCPMVSIAVNGTPAAVQSLGQGTYVARGVRLQPGENRITAQGTALDGTAIVADSCTWTLQ